MFGDGVLFFIVCLATPNVITATNTTTHQLPTVAGTASSSMVTPAPEPGPDWPVAKQQWGHTWELHWIGMAIAFAILACRSLWAIFSRTPDVNSRFARRNLYYSINWLLVALGITRSLYLLIDPYESGENIPNCPLWVDRPLFGIAFPCLMSAYCLVHVAFLEVAKIQLVSPKLSSLRFVAGIILVHFSVVIVSDTTAAIEADSTELLIVCQSFFIVWGLLNSISFLYSGTRVVIKTRNIRNRICEMVNAEWNLQGLQSKSAERRAAEKEPSCEKKETARQPSTPQNDHNRGGPKVAYTIQPLGFGNNLTVGALGTKHKVPSQGPKQAKGQRQPKATFGPTGRERAIQNIASITVITSILSISCCALQLYSLFGVYGAYSKIMSPKPWPWMAFQTSFRFVELILAFMLSHCVLRSRPGWRRNILTRLFNRRRTRKTQAPHVITIVQVKDAFQERLA
ncbi:uncharacterized protein LOC144640401 [Oculina patagonica]